MARLPFIRSNWNRIFMLSRRIQGKSQNKRHPNYTLIVILLTSKGNLLQRFEFFQFQVKLTLKMSSAMFETLNLVSISRIRSSYLHITLLSPLSKCHNLLIMDKSLLPTSSSTLETCETTFILYNIKFLISHPTGCHNLQIKDKLLSK